MAPAPGLTAPRCGGAEPPGNSCMIVVATDAPLGALFKATTTTGQGRTSHAVPYDRLRRERP
ncbi:hypothetical protein ABZW11_23915 [Nonomuraea sp. NPDC004580]|uniref:hypothetical protein n=1 Tax=Nonomuraea sp. NPDC004580 TaxID=3154552 RepID=UPI00339F2321